MINNQNGISKIFVISLIFVSVLSLGGVYIYSQAGREPVVSKPAEYTVETVAESSATSGNNTPVNDAKVVSPPKASMGMIEGSLSFPSQGIPDDLKVCAYDITDNEKIYCTQEHVTAAKYQYGVGYVLEVPVGTYTIGASTSALPEYIAYYTEAVTCGLTVSCTDHTPIQITVASGDIISSIDPGDWYADTP